MFKYLLKYRKLYLVGSLLLLIVNLLAAYIPQLIQEAIDSIQSPQINQQLDLIIILSITMAIARIFSRQVLFGAGRTIEYDLKQDLFSKLLSLDLNFFQSRRTGDLISIMTNDVQAMRALAGFAILNIINTIMAFGIILPLMFQINIKITSLFLITIPAVLLGILLLSKQIKKHQEEVQIKLGELSNFLEENLSAMHIIKSYSQEEPEIERFETYNQGLKNSYLKLIKFRSFMSPIMRVITSLGLIILLGLGGRYIIDGSLSQGEFAAYLLYIYRLIWPITTLGWLITVIYRSQVSFERINQILNTQAKIQNQSNPTQIQSIHQGLPIQGHSIPVGLNLGIVGPVASGKSTIATRALRLTEPNPGEVLIDGLDIPEISIENLRSLIGLVPQENILFPVSISQNIAYARDADLVSIEKFAKLVAIEDEIKQLPDGFNSIVGERGVTLSGGQRQRLSIARALIMNPSILFLDNALSHLDSTTSSQVLKSICDYRHNQTTILITHKLEQIQNFDLIWVIENSKIQEVGTHQELISKADSIYKRLWEASNA